MPQPIYRSTDAGAPVLNNVTGSLCALLDACLVNGYGSKAPLGWSIKFTATNRRVYKMGAGTGFELGVDEIGLVSQARVRAAESYSDISTFAGGFPTVAQMASGIWWQKTINVVTARAWVVIGDRKRFFFFTQWDGGTTNTCCAFFGDIVPYKVGGDPYACMIFGMKSIQSESNNDRDYFGDLGASLNTVQTNHFIARSHTGLGASLANGKYADGQRSATFIGFGNMPYPDPITGSIHLSRVFVSEPSPATSVRGYVPGLWALCHHRDTLIGSGVVAGDSFSGSDGLSTRSFEIRFTSPYQSIGGFAFETSDWPESA